MVFLIFDYMLPDIFYTSIVKHNNIDLKDIECFDNLFYLCFVISF